MADPRPIRTLAIKHDGELAIATGGSRFETQWKNKLMRWSALVERLQNTTRTPETAQEYRRLSKAQRDSIKDVGGFVGGSLKQGRRKAENIANRSMLTLDMDEVSASVEAVWETVRGLAGACVLYSTHSHTPASPRLRLVIPLSRPVMGDEYQAVARKLAEDAGIDQFDDTTYEPHRLMYWPSTPQDGDYVCKWQDGPWLDPDAVLAQYPDWRDVSYWPESSRQAARITGQMARQEDPLSKGGLVGAFCRSYSIAEAMETFLPGVYEPTGHEGRYTYAQGSTVGGVVVYEDRWSYSHHGTDPASGVLCNAFDLVRIHRFSNLDDEVKPDTPANRMPSFVAMGELASADGRVRELIGRERLAQAMEEFDLDGTAPAQTAAAAEPDTSWMRKLAMTRKGEVTNSIPNIRIILDNDPNLKDRLKYNEFTNQNIAAGALPWDKHSGRTWTDTDDAGVRDYMERVYGIVGPGKIADAVDLTFKHHRFHPVREYLESLQWDGVSVVDTLLIDYLGAPDTEYVRTVTRKWICGAVARAMKPGTKFDHMLVLTGPQGSYKSTFLRMLAGDEWFTDSLQDVEGNQAVEKLMGSWIIEFGELQAFSRSESNAIKRFVTSQEDRTRLAYDRRIKCMPRQCVFAGSTNKREFLKDETGNRRYWPVEVRFEGRMKNVVEDLPEERDQIWAEAVALWDKGRMALYLNPEQEAMAQAQQDAHREVNEKEGLILDYLEKLLPDGWDYWGLHKRRNYIAGMDVVQGTARRDRVCVLEIWCECFEQPRASLRKTDSIEINAILGNLEGWRPSGRLEYFGEYGRQRGYERV